MSRKRPCCFEYDKENPQLELVLTPELKKYGRWVCAFCKKFIKMAGNPKYDEEWQMRVNYINSLDPLISEKMEDKERGVLKSCVEIKNISPAQWKWFESIKKKYNLPVEEIPDWKKKTRDASTDTSDLIELTKVIPKNPYKRIFNIDSDSE